MAAERLDDIQAGLVMINLIDTVSAVALPFLAQQLNMLGYKGWKFADTEQRQRDLLKRAIDFHRYSGTPYGVKQALEFAGIVGAIEIQERINIVYDGSWHYNGIVFYGNHWAYFRVLIDTANLNGLTMADIKGVINVYKGARNWLLDVAYKQTLSDTVEVSDSLDREITVGLEDTIELSEDLTVTELPFP